MHIKCSFFPFHVVQIFFQSIFKEGDPEIRDPRLRLPYNGPIIYALFDKKFSDPFNCRFFTIFQVFDLLPRWCYRGSMEEVEGGLLYD